MKRREILKWLSTVQFEAHHEETKKLRFKGTGEWLIQKEPFHRWIETDSSSMMWLSGKRMIIPDTEP